MNNYKCEKCGKEFIRKSGYTSHMKRKTPCEITSNSMIKKTSTIDDSNIQQDKSLDYSTLSYTLTKSISKIDKKNNGIYFTPPQTIDKNIKFLEPYLTNIRSVLEPSCGSGEYITAISKNYENISITGIELNKTIYDSIKYFENNHDTNNNNQIKIYNDDFLTRSTTETYDLIIGNPPYFVMKKEDVNKSYFDFFDGRPNIFILFIVKSLKMLNPSGILSFVLPKNFLNCLYYDKTRKYISQHFKILNIIECNDDYIETKQDTIILILQNNGDLSGNEIFILNKNHYTIFGISENIAIIKSLYEGSSTLSNLNFKVNVGSVVWNQCKDILTNDSKKTLLIYSSDIKNNKLDIQEYSNDEKKNYIDKKGTREPVLVINRGYGVGSYNFDYCLIEGGFDYLIENHLICVKYTQPISNTELISIYKKIIRSLEDTKTQQFIELYFGNNAINTTELCEILPIYDI